MKTAKVAYVDFCRTVTFRYSLRPFLDYCAAGFGTKSRFRLATIGAVNWFRRGTTAQLAAKFFKGCTSRDIERHALSYVHQELLADINRSTVRRLHSLKAEGYKVVIVSAALREYIQYCESILGADDSICNSLAYDESGTATGSLSRVTEVYGHGKVEAIREYESRNQLTILHRVCLSDHDSDIPMLELAQKAYVVNPCTRAFERYAQLRGWEVLSSEELIN